MYYYLLQDFGCLIEIYDVDNLIIFSDMIFREHLFLMSIEQQKIIYNKTKIKKIGKLKLLKIINKIIPTINR